MRTACWSVYLTVVLVALFYHVQVYADHFLNEWTAEIPGGLRQARDVAAQHGYTLVRELHSLPDHYILHRSDTPHRSKRGAEHHTRKLEDDHRVTFVQQQESRERVKREVSSRDLARSIVEIDSSHLDDPAFGQEWYINQPATAERSDDSVVTMIHGSPLRVTEVWKMGITGKGAVVSIIDDGIETNHPDLAVNYDPYASYDYNDNDPDPSPRYEITNENKHGTRCAGEVAMVANNNNCGVGVAFDSKIGGIRILDGTVTDRVEAEALSFNVSHVDIYSASWGPTDDGTKLDGPRLLANKAFLKGINKGRGGKGILYAWASGNGGRVGDSCSCDGYASSIYTISISSSGQFGTIPWYSEKCASTITTTYSSGNGNEKKITTSDLHHKCTDQHSGTSAAAPLGAGVLALLLEANPDLTWREVQHILVHTSRKEPLAHAKGWYKNAAGYCVNLSFGFGLMDALGMVTLGNKSTWTPVGPQRICSVEATNKDSFPQQLSSGNFLEVEFTTDGCEGQKNEVNFLEHVIVNFNISYPQRGRISAEIESPGGTIVELMPERKHDKSQKGFPYWPLMSVHTWGEQPEGTWKFRVMDKNDGNFTGTLSDATLILFGTTEQPEYQKTHPAKCDHESTVQKSPVDDNKTVDDTIDDVKGLLSSEKSSYVHSKLEELLRKNGEYATRFDRQKLARVLKELNL